MSYLGVDIASMADHFAQDIDIVRCADRKEHRMIRCDQVRIIDIFALLHKKVQDPADHVQRITVILFDESAARPVLMKIDIDGAGVCSLFGRSCPMAEKILNTVYSKIFDHSQNLVNFLVVHIGSFCN